MAVGCSRVACQSLRVVLLGASALSCAVQPSQASIPADPPSGPALSPSPDGTAGLERLDVPLERIRAQADPELRSQLLLDLLERCLSQVCPLELPALVEEGDAAVASLSDPPRRLALRLRLASLQQHHGFDNEARASLERARADVAAAPAAQREALTLRLGLAFAGLRDAQQASLLMAESERERLDGVDRRKRFPFPEEKLEGRVGLAFSAATYEDTTANAVASFDLYKQWPRSDFETDFFASINYDSSRDFNATWPISQGYLVYRRHLDRRRYLFADQFVAVNDSTFSAQDDDDDVSVLSSIGVGLGYEFWRGLGTGSFQALQLGVGARYEYAEIDLRRRRDQVDPIVALIYRAREIPLGRAKWSQIFSLAAPVDSFDEAFVFASARLDWPISTHWLWTNRLSVRYRSRPIQEDYPNWNLILSTGLTYQF